MSGVDVSRAKQGAVAAAMRAAGARIMEVYARGTQAEYKSDGSPVTEADQAAEAILLPMLATEFPGVTVISEENAASHALAAQERFFLVDPLDGTKEFLRRDGKGSFTVNVALIEEGVPVFGMVYAPALDRFFAGQAGAGAFETAGGVTRAISVRPPAARLTAVASSSHRDADTNAWLEAHGVEDTVSIGSSLKFCLVAAGEADVYPRFGPTMEWDTAAGDAVLRAAGGAMTHPDGAVFGYGKAEYRNGAFIAWGGLRG